jgi:syntaxin 8
MSLAKLTAVSTKTLSLILERQRLQALPSYSSDGISNGSSLHYPQIKRNLNQLREGILALEAKEGSSTDATKLLCSQYERMRGMLWEEEQAEIPRYVYLVSQHNALDFERVLLSLDARQTSTSQPPSSESQVQPHITRQNARDSLLSQPTFAPYTDDPDQGPSEPPEPATLLQVQRLLMDSESFLRSTGSPSLNTKFQIKINGLMNFRTP